MIQVARNGGTGLIQGCGLPLCGLRAFHAALGEKGAGRLVARRPLPLQQFTLDDAFEGARSVLTGARSPYPPGSLNRVGLLRVPR